MVVRLVVVGYVGLGVVGLCVVGGVTYTGLFIEAASSSSLFDTQPSYTGMNRQYVNLLKKWSGFGTMVEG